MKAVVTGRATQGKLIKERQAQTQRSFRETLYTVVYRSRATMYLFPVSDFAMYRNTMNRKVATQISCGFFLLRFYRTVEVRNLQGISFGGERRA